MAPDIVHLHNSFPLLTPSVLDACIDARVPVVHTLHNYRQFCANGVLLRQGSQCQLCLHGSSLNAVRYKCYRGSRLGSLAVVRMIARHRRLQTWQTKVDRFIAPSPFSKDLLTSAGLPGDRIVVKPHFTPEPAVLEPAGPRDYALYVGRLSVEKGIEPLLQAWRAASHELHVVGDGPLRDLVQSAMAMNSRIKYLGQLDRDGVDREMRGAAYLVFPSVLPETFGMTIVEAYAQGVPVLTSRLGSQAQLVADGVTGMHFAAGDASELAHKAEWLWSNAGQRREMGARGRREYEEKYTAQKNKELLLAVYDDVLAARR